ncbi:ferroxidase FET5 NDAI_0G01730 [Naumovozyma dairenensis CBS 421]|uniref:Iron transport multicopper oxidase FET5 n=1 Tax=Naumovozyma dairenensis (strain ATCC 10597 / BCRC 20456 / CBS 421 / NBRC 0211 / NRRL Y-12639) TaxID=1071378 RepID=G0WDT8_NAUDC|nr:hypothetical protein NDAI_0G01730 [Naumovozyma dairenensis CBS 421]CCD25949.2 hypothetical protein NDAI_0G01730 [Naumovozyma dairenensis CBS 421]
MHLSYWHSHLLIFITLASTFFNVTLAKTRQFNFTASWITAKPDGIHEKKMIGFNGKWPPPDIHVNKGDRIELYLTNGFQDNHTVTSLHFHGMFQNSTFDDNQNLMDGPSMVTQCPIVPGQTYLYNFTTGDQIGTYWYHAHHSAQYGDGMRAALIIHDDDIQQPFQYDKEFVIGISDLYWKPYDQVTDKFLSRYNPTGAEPIPDLFLFNNTVNETLHFETNKTYLLRFINMGLFVSQYISLEDHQFTIVEVDGMYVKPNITDVLYLAAAQRMSVLVKSKETDPGKNFALMQIVDQTMLDAIPPNLPLNMTNQVAYGDDYSKPHSIIPQDFEKLATNDFYLEPYYDNHYQVFKDYDQQIVLDVRMRNLGDGIKYAFFNNISFVDPKIPILTTILTSGKLADDPRIYGENVNPFFFKKNQIIEVVLNNYDTGRHPFHLHGHNFQIVQKSNGFHIDEQFPEELQDEMTVPYNESNPLMPIPEIPMIRDTVVLEPNGHVVLRFKADNPGVWYFHCHVDWHLQQGLAAVFIEDPFALQRQNSLTDNYKDICSAANIANEGNAAGNYEDWFDLDGLPRQPDPLPEGFTLKGYIAFAISTLCGIWGLYTITKYGMFEDIPDNESLYTTLKTIIEENEISVK